MMKLLTAEIVDFNSFSSMKIFLTIEVYIKDDYENNFWGNLELKGKKYRDSICIPYIFPFIHGLIKE